MGVDDLTIQAILRHSNVAVTQACYIIYMNATPASPSGTAGMHSGADLQPTRTASKETQAAMQKVERALTDTNVTPKQPLPMNRAVQ